MIKCEIREHYDSYGTGNFIEDKSRRDTFEMTEERFEKVVALHNAMGRKRRETSKHIVYFGYSDRRHCTEYIYYK